MCCPGGWWVEVQDYTPVEEGPQEYQTVPLSKIEDFGSHVKRYGVRRAAPACIGAVRGIHAAQKLPWQQANANARYYPLEVSYFKSSADNALLSLLWSKYWVNTLSSNPLLGVRGRQPHHARARCVTLTGLVAALLDGRDAARTAST